MSAKTSIKVQYVNQPKSPKGPGSVKTFDGVYYKVWPKAKDGGATLSQFEAGRTYEIEFDTEQYEGQDKYVARKILSSSESSNGSNGSPASVGTFVQPESDRSARIERQAALKVAVQFLALEIQTGISAASEPRLFGIADKILAYVDGNFSTPTAPVEQEVEI